MVFVGLINREAEKKQSSEYAEYSTQSMCKVICPMDEYGESRTLSLFMGKTTKSGLFICLAYQYVGSSRVPNSVVLAYYEGNVV